MELLIIANACAMAAAAKPGLTVCNSCAEANSCCCWAKILFGGKGGPSCCTGNAASCGATC